MNAPPLIALPGTLLDTRSLAGVLQGRDALTLIVGEATTLDDELDRLAACAPQPSKSGPTQAPIVGEHVEGSSAHPGHIDSYRHDFNDEVGK